MLYPLKESMAPNILYPTSLWTLAKKAFSNSGLPRYIVLPKDFEAGYKNNIKKDESEHEFYK